MGCVWVFMALLWASTEMLRLLSALTKPYDGMLVMDREKVNRELLISPINHALQKL